MSHLIELTTTYMLIHNYSKKRIKNPASEVAIIAIQQSACLFYTTIKEKQE